MKEMGYTTEFQGILKFTRDLTTAELRLLNAILSEDCRDHPEWNAPDLYYVDLEIAADFSGLQWSRAEKTYSMDKLVNVVIDVMRRQVPDFGLMGALRAQGEDADDRWDLVIGEDGWAHRVDIPPPGVKICCPHCERHFYYEAKQEDE